MTRTIPEIDGIIETRVRNARDRNILHRVMIDGIPYEQVAEESSCCRNTVFNVVRRHKPLFDE